MSSRLRLSARLSAQDLILRAERETGEFGFDEAERAEKVWEKEAVIGAENFEGLFLQECFGLRRRDHDRVAVEDALRHYVARGGTPRIVFPEGKESSGAEAAMDVGDGGIAGGEGNVVKDAVAVGEVDGLPFGKFLESEELACRRAIALGCEFDGARRNVDADYTQGVEGIL